jgi:hypothetical protein
MEPSRRARIAGEGGLAMLIIVLLLLLGIVWWLFSSRRTSEKNIRVFAAEVAREVAVNYNEQYLHLHLSSDGQKQYLRSWRDRLFEQLRGLGVPAQPIEIEGQPSFTNYFFDPAGEFKARLKYPDKNTTAEMTLGISRSMNYWQVDTISLYWTLPPTPTPAPTPVMAPTPSPTPAAKAKRTHR